MSNLKECLDIDSKVGSATGWAFLFFFFTAVASIATFVYKNHASWNRDISIDNEPVLIVLIILDILLGITFLYFARRCLIINKVVENKLKSKGCYDLTDFIKIQERRRQPRRRY